MLQMRTLPPGTHPDVDDHPANLVALEAILGDLGQAGEGALGRGGAAHLLREDFALILLDVQMPGLDGFETARLIKQRERTRHIPIIFLTALSRDALARVPAATRRARWTTCSSPSRRRSCARRWPSSSSSTSRGRSSSARRRCCASASARRWSAQSEHRYRLLVDAMPLCVLAASPDGRLRYGNRAWTELSGLPAEAVEDLWRSEWCTRRTASGAHAAWCRVGAHRPALRGAGPPAPPRDGSYRWHLARAVPERDERGRIIGWIVTATDIDDQKRAEEALAQASAAKDDFLAAASHELRTPLAAAKMQVQLAQRKYGAELTDGPRRAFEGLGRQVDRMTKLVSDLLDVSRLLTGRLSLEVEAFDLVPLLRATCERLQALSSEHQLRLEVARVAAHARRPGPHRAGGDQPGVQRHPLLAPGRRGGAARVVRGRAAHAPGAGPRHRHSGGKAARSSSNASVRPTAHAMAASAWG